MEYYNKCPRCGFIEETSTENTSFLCTDCKKERQKTSEVTELINKFWETHQEREESHIAFQEKIEDIFEKSNMKIGMITISNESSFEIFYPENIMNQGDLKKLNTMFEDYLLAYIESTKEGGGFNLTYSDKNKQIKKIVE